MTFKLNSSFKPTGDQPQAIERLNKNLKLGYKNQLLVGVTGSGKTFTMANVIKERAKPALIISHNKTLAAQLYQEFRDFFPQNAVSYFVSYYDYYQPEAYIPQTDTYIEKETEINEEIDKLRLSATTNILTRKDVIIIASVSCIYNIGSPKEYGAFVMELRCGMKISRESVASRLVDLQYSKSNFDFKRGTFRTRGEIFDIYPAYLDNGIRLVEEKGKIKEIYYIHPLTGKRGESLEKTVIYPAKHYMTGMTGITAIYDRIREDLDIRVLELKNQNKTLEAHRLNQRVNFDLEMIEEFGYVNGIENYSRYFDGRKPGEAPYTLLDYFQHAYKDDWLLFIDESHMTVPQIRGMYNGDRARKEVLIDFGFRLPAARDNRPLTFAEFQRRIPQTIYVSATPDEWELDQAKISRLSGIHDVVIPNISGTASGQNEKLKNREGIIEQLIRPTGVTDPQIYIRPTNGQIDDLLDEIIKRKIIGERVLVTTLTKRMAEDLAQYLNEKKYVEYEKYKNLDQKYHPTVQYLHSDVETLERSDILDNLRLGKYDVLIGINLLREGLDLPEVSMVAILDADKEGFLRSYTSLIQTMGRAARHIKGTVIMYADIVTNSMEKAIKEIERRRHIQIEYNLKNHIIPATIAKPIRQKLVERRNDDDEKAYLYLDRKKRIEYRSLLQINPDDLTPRETTKLVNKLRREMRHAASDLNFELAAEIRDRIRELEKVRKLY